MQTWGWSALGRLLRFLPLATYTILVTEAMSTLGVAQLSDHQAVVVKLSLLAARSTGR